MILSLNTLLRVFFYRRPKYNKKFKISICGIFKDEASFLREWVEYHEMIGVDHFYLYNNNSTDNYLAVLQPYIDRGLITLIDFPYNHAQIKAYKDFYEKFRHETQWVSFLDIDEFIVPTKANDLLEWIKGYEKYPVILIYWKMFGTSGLMKHDWGKLVTEQYHVCWSKIYHCGKCLINTDYDILKFDSNTHHCPTMIYPVFGIPFRARPINQFKSSCIGKSNSGFFRKENNPTIQINHYWSKAWDIYDSKRNKTDVFFKENPKNDIRYFLFHENQNSSSDYNIYRFLMQLKLKLNNID